MRVSIPEVPLCRLSSPAGLCVIKASCWKMCHLFFLPAGPFEADDALYIYGKRAGQGHQVLGSRPGGVTSSQLGLITTFYEHFPHSNTRQQKVTFAH